MDWTAWAVNIAFLGMPPVSCIWGWWLWRRQTEKHLVVWRQKASTIALVTSTLSVVAGAFAMLYWRRSPGLAVPPDPTKIATLVGFGFAVFAVPFAVLANSWMRVALVLCCAGLMGFYFGMFLAP
jgi:hypothetical protein